MQISLASHWDMAAGEIHRWINGSVRRLPAIALRTTTEHFNTLTPNIKLILLQESVDMMEQLHLPDRAARSFRDILTRRLEAEKRSSGP